MEHIENNNLFSNKQFGFLNGRSTVLQLLTVLDKWTKFIDEGGTIVSGYHADTPITIKTEAIHEADSCIH